MDDVEICFTCNEESPHGRDADRWCCLQCGRPADVAPPVLDDGASAAAAGDRPGAG